MNKAVSALKSGLTEYAKTPTEFMRDAYIQRFEVTYEVSHKMLKRFPEATSASPAEIDAMNFADLIRTGSERGLLLNDWPQWKSYRNARSLTSHTYDETKSRDVFASIPAFLTLRLDLSATHARIARDILAGRLPPGSSVRVFGSRATGRAKRFCDLNLAIKTEGPLSLSLLGDLADAFSQRDPPFKVDVVDWFSAPPFLQAIIERDGVELTADSPTA